MELAIMVVLVALIGFQQYMLLRQANDADARVERLLARISTEPRIEFRPVAAPESRVDPDEVKYVSDEAYHDEMWNNFHAEPSEELS